MSLDHSKLEKLKQRGSKIEAQCPACFEVGQDQSGNHLAIFADGAFSCVAHAGDKNHRRRIAELAGDSSDDWRKDAPQSFVGDSNGPSAPSTHPKREAAKYDYHDAEGNVVYQVVRYEPKDFRQRRIVDGQLVWNMDGISRVLYRLPEVLKAETVWITEGEKDADALAALGHVATCNPGGAGKWQDSFTESLRGKDVVLCGDNDEPGQRHVEKVEAALTGVARSIRRVIVPSPSKDISDHLAGLRDSEAIVAIDELLNTRGPLDALLDARRFDVAHPPEKPMPVLLVAGKPIATAGNLVAVTAQAKAGKTALLTGMIAALMEPSGDCLGITGANSDGLAVLHFDTEQSRCDHHAVVLQTLRRVGRDKPPEWLRSYSLADVPTKERRKALAHEMNRAAVAGKLCAVFLDGVADLCIDPNDPAEAFGLVEELHRLAITYDCPIVCVLHENPGSETGKTRGHLGSQLERKAETNLRLAKDGKGVTTVFTERSRHCHIPRESGPSFVWDEAAGMHISCGTARDEKAAAKAQEMAGIVDRIFDGKTTVAYRDLVTVMVSIRNTNKRNAEKFVNRLTPDFITRTPRGLYVRKI